jgi:superfamily II DNA/RNA helicase
VEGISRVISYHMPDTADAYVHRIRRTGQASRKGDLLPLMTPDDDCMVRELEKVNDQRCGGGPLYFRTPFSLKNLAAPGCREIPVPVGPSAKV